MINIRKLMETLAEEIVEITKDPNLQVIDRKYLDNIPNNILKTPRVIVDLLSVRDSDFHYNDESIDKDGKISLSTQRISTVDIAVSFISSFNDEKAEVMAEQFRDYYMSHYTKKLKEFNAVVVSTPDIQDINAWNQKKDINIIRVRLTAKVQNINTYNPSNNELGWCEKANGELIADGEKIEFGN